MKKQPLLWLFVIILFAVSCKNSSKKQETTSEETTTSAPPASGLSSASSSSDIEAAATENQKRIEELKKLKPISNESLKAIFPDEVMGMKRSSFSVNSAMGYAAGNAEYKKDDTTSYKVNIYDCAGEAGSAFYAMQFLTGWNMETEDDNGYQKTVNFNGKKALETYRKSGNQHTLNYVSGDRFWVTLEGNNTGIDNLKSFADKLDLDKLKDVK